MSVRAKYNFTELYTPCDENVNQSIKSTSSVLPRSTSTSDHKKSSDRKNSSSKKSSEITFFRSSSSRTPRSHNSSHTPHTSSVRRTPHLSSGGPSKNLEPSSIVAVVEGRGHARGEIGIASLDLKSPQLVLSQFSDSSTYVKVITKLQILDPLEILMPSTVCDSTSMTKLFKQIADQFPNMAITTVQRKYFNETKGLQYIKHLCVPEFSSVEIEVNTKYYCLATAAALLKYVEFIQNVVYAPNSLKIIFRGSEQTCMIDAHTARYLELIQNMRDPKSTHSLYGVLHHTRTLSGARVLRANILQPPCNEHTILTRLECVAELTEKENMFYGLQSLLGKFLDIDLLLSLCIQIPKQENVKTAENKIAQVIYLKHTLELIAPLKEVLEECENTLLKAYKESLNDPRYNQIYIKICKIVQEEVKFQKGALNMRTQKCFAVKPNINGLLDIARRSYCEVVDDIAEMVKQLSEHYNLPLRTGYNVSRGFYIQMYVSGKQNSSLDIELPSVFIKKSKFKNTLSFTTEDLIKMNDRVRESLNEIYLMSNVIVSELLCEIRDEIGCMYKLTEIISMLDLLVAFSHACTLSDYVKPEFTNTLAIKHGRHPILEKIATVIPVSNNTYLADDCNFMIITGPNMSGKSTYLKQIALLQVMAQIGSFVPAEYASFRIADHIFSRMGSDDDIETNASTFMVEMREMNYIIQNATDKSLIIIDELGRGTSVEEGVGLCHAICEHLLKLKSFTICATHFQDLTNLDTIYPNVLNFHFEVQEQRGDDDAVSLNYTHALAKGITDFDNYGLKLAEVSNLPPAVVEDAKELAEKIRIQRKANEKLSQESKKKNAVFHLANRLIQVASHSKMDNAMLREYLKMLKNQYFKEINE